MYDNEFDPEFARITDKGPNASVINIDRASKANNDYRRALWTGDHLQVTLMSIPVGGEIGLEIHEGLDQFIRIEFGRAEVLIGKSKDIMSRTEVNGSYALMIPSGVWHNVVNKGPSPLKLYSIYAPPHHPFGTVQGTKKEADEAEK